MHLTCTCNFDKYAFLFVIQYNTCTPWDKHTITTYLNDTLRHVKWYMWGRDWNLTHIHVQDIRSVERWCVWGYRTRLRIAKIWLLKNEGSSWRLLMPLGMWGRDWNSRLRCSVCSWIIHEFIFFVFVTKKNIVSILLCAYTVALLISNYYSAC